MTLGVHDLHLILSRDSRTGRLYDSEGRLLLAFEARNRTTNDAAPVSQRDAPCPPGEFILGAPVPMGTPPFGAFFIPLEDYGDHHTMAENHRSGIGIHAGGSGLPHPLVQFQSPPWVVTHGCWRVDGFHLQQLVNHVRLAQALKGTVFVTVEPFAAAAEPGDTGDWLDVPFDQLDPDE